MNYNLNSHYGLHVANNLPFRVAGKIFIVGKDGLAHLDMYKEIFVPDADGNVRYFNTIQGAVDACTANAGDTILILPGHTETISAAGGIQFNKAGISVIGLGNAGNRPTITLDTATTVDIDVSADDVYIENIVTVGDVANITKAWDISGNDVTLFNTRHEVLTSGKPTLSAITITGDRCRVEGFVFMNVITTGSRAITMTGTDQTVLRNCKLIGEFGGGPIGSVTTANTNLEIRDIIAHNKNGGTSNGIVLQSADTGSVGPNIYIRINVDGANITEAVSVGSDCHFFDPIYIVNANDERALQWNHTQSADA